MNTLLGYVIEVNAGIILFFAIYYALFRNETDFRKQRYYMLAGLIVSILAPVFHVSANLLPQVASQAIDSIVILPEMSVIAYQSFVQQSSSWNWVELVTVGYVAVATVIAIPLIIQAVKLTRVQRASNAVYKGDFLVVESDTENASWSFFNLIFIGKSDNISDEAKQMIVRHEMLHGRLKHSFDILVATLLSVLFWVNPFVWMYRRAMSRIHEFEVDSIITSDTNKADYCLLLARTTVGDQFLFTHAFNKSFILKRIDMINNLKKNISGWKIAASVSVLVLFVVVTACDDSLPEATMQNVIEVKSQDGSFIAKQAVMPKDVADAIADLSKSYPNRTYEVGEISHEQLNAIPANGESLVLIFAYHPKPGLQQIWAIKETGRKNTGNEIFTIVEETARPPLGMTKYYESLGQALQYPDDARQKGIEGKVFIEFVVNEVGELSDYHVVRGINESLDTEAMRAMMQLSPARWSPATQGGKPVSERMVLPITFKLE